MLLFFKKYFKRRPPKSTREETEDNNSRRITSDMPPDNISNSASYICFHGCLTAEANPAPIEQQSDQTTTGASATAHATTTTTTRVTRANFSRTTTSSLFPSTQFTNHESLPSMSDAFAIFLSVFPQYGGTQTADTIRQFQYSHLLTHACFDYSGIGLFSHSQMDPDNEATTSSYNDGAARNSLKPPFFEIAYRSASLRSQVQSRDNDTSLEAEIRKRIMKLLSISDEEYSMVCTANRTTAFRLLAESYAFKPNNKLLTVYDYESEAVSAMIETVQKRGADVAAASFTWPGMRINKKLTKKITERKKRKGLFVFPLISRMTGTRYPYLWMKLAQDHGWHIALDACALGPKDMDSLGLSLIQPDFIICNFYKVFGENPSGFAGLFVKKSSCEALERSSIARSIGIVNIVPARRFSLTGDYSGTDLEASQPLSMRNGEDDLETTCSFSGPIGPLNRENASQELGNVSRILEEEKTPQIEVDEDEETGIEIECHSLDHAHKLGLVLITTRLRCITNWLVVALSKLRHPTSTHGYYLVRIYGPRVKFDRGPALAFNIFDWKGEKIDPFLVQKLGDRSGISLSFGFLKNILFENEHEDSKIVLEKKRGDEYNDVGIGVVNVSFGFLCSFEDAYKLWAFVAKFLDADFVEKERWRYMALNQRMIEI